jgi:competence protein ComFC
MNEIQSRLKSWLEAALAFFYPEVCQLCRAERATSDEGYTGPQCRQQVRWIEPPFCQRCGLPFEGAITTAFECSNCREMKLSFLSARSAVVARGVALEAIHRYKYQRALWFEPFLAGLLVRQAAPLLGTHNCDLLVPVPLHPLKQREREFNQAERLARCLGQVTHLPVNSRLLQRVKPTRTQTLLSRTDRAANVRNAFAVRRGLGLQGERVVLVDDVMTTGATTNACARTLLTAGAGSVSVWTVARGV